MARVVASRDGFLALFDPEKGRGVSGEGLDLYKDLARQRRLIHAGRPLAADLFSPVSFSYRIFGDQDRLRIEGELAWRGRTLFLSECDHVIRGEPHAFVLGPSFKLIAGEIEWEWIERVAHTGGWQIPRSEWPELERALRRDGEYAPGYLFEAEEVDWQPCLRLGDERGLFAEMWVESGESRLVQGAAYRDHEADLREAGYVRHESGYYCPADKVTEALELLLGVGWSITDREERRVALPEQSEIHLEKGQEGPRAKGHILLQGSGKLDLGTAVGGVQAGRQLIGSGDQVALLSKEWARSHLSGLLEGEVVGEEVHMRRSQVVALETVSEVGAVGNADSLGALLSARVEPPSELQATLRPYQQEGFSWLSAHVTAGLGAILADEMGLGKTVQLIALLVSLGREKCSLIVAPRSLLTNWEREVGRFAPHLPFYVHHGSDRLVELPKRGVVLTSYATLRRDIELLLSHSFDLIALDEAQWIKNADSQTARAIFRLQAKARLALTGTPIENRWEELWSLFRFVQPDLLCERDRFALEMAESSARRRWHRRMAPFLLRRTKKEVALEVPDKEEQTVWVEWSDEEKVLYNEFYTALRRKVLKRVTGTGESRPMEILEGLLRLRQLCCHPLLLGSRLAKEAPRCSSKQERVIADVEQLAGAGSRVIVYSQFTQMLDLLERELHSMGRALLRLDGATLDRQSIVDRFQRGEVEVLLVSLKAGGVGHTLTAADAVLLYEPWWNEAVEQQAIDRAHRIGQEKRLLVRRYVVADSIEERMMALKEVKSQALSTLFGEADATRADNFDEQLWELFELK